MTYPRLPIRQRPDGCVINPRALLAHQLVFAFVGGPVGSRAVQDVSPTGCVGALHADIKWVDIPRLARRGLSLAARGVVFDDETFLDGATDVSFSFWLVPTAWISGDKRIINKWDSGESYLVASVGSYDIRFATYNGASYYICDTTGNPMDVGDQNRPVPVSIRWRGGSPQYTEISVWGSKVTDTQNSVNLASIQNVSGAFEIGGVAAPGGVDSQITDVLIHRRWLSDAEVSEFADPSNMMLSGLLEPPSLLWWPVGRALGEMSVINTLGAITHTGSAAVTVAGSAVNTLSGCAQVSRAEAVVGGATTSTLAGLQQRGTLTAYHACNATNTLGAISQAASAIYTVVPPQYHTLIGPPAEYYVLVGSSAEYRPICGPPTEYHVLRGPSAEYHPIAGPSSEYHALIGA